MKKLVYSSAISASVNIIAVTVITIWADLAPQFKSWVASLTGHHWITKSLMAVILFPLVLGLVYGFSRGEITDKQTAKSLWALVVITIVGFVIILGFYIWHYF